MKRVIGFCLLFLCSGLTTFAQGQFAGGGGVSSGSASPASSIFYIASNCAGVGNCLQWVDDDSTDNCGTATTNFMASINSYAGPGNAHVFITGSGSGKAYKLSSCSLTFTGPTGTFGETGSANIVSNATIDCAQASGNNCIQSGASSLTSYTQSGNHNFYWRGGTFTGCVNLAHGCLEMPPWQYFAVFDDINFNNTGAGNATVGNCTNYSLYFGTDVGAIEVSRNTFLGQVSGQCFSFNNDVTTAGANTILMRGNVISMAHGGYGGVCGSQAHLDSSSHSTIVGNTFFAFASNLTLQNNTNGEGGWNISDNNFDTGQCQISGTQYGAVQFGGSHVVGPVSFTNNDNQTAPFISQAPSSSATMAGWTVTGNTTRQTNALLISATSPACASLGTQNPCVMGANPGFSITQVAGNSFPGWLEQTGNYGHNSFTAQTANLSATAINPSGSSLIAATVLVNCQVILTAAGTTSTMPSCTVSWTDLLTSVVESATITSTSTANTVGTQSNGTVFATIKAGTNVTVSTSGYASTGTAMQYAVFADISKVF